MRPRGQTPRMRGNRESFNAIVVIASMRPRGQTPRMHPRQPMNGRRNDPGASMRPRGQTPRMLEKHRVCAVFHQAASMRPRGQTPRMPRQSSRPVGRCSRRFNEAAGADPADARPANAPAPRGWHASMRPRGQTPRMRTARKSLCVNGLPWQLRAVSRRRVATAGAAMTSRGFLDHNYPVVKDLPALRALPGVAAAPQRSIRKGEMRIIR